MESIDIHEAKRRFTWLVEQAARGKSFVITKAGEPLVKVVPFSTPTGRRVKRLGFLDEQFNVIDDSNQVARKDVEQLFEVDP